MVRVDPGLYNKDGTSNMPGVYGQSDEVQRDTAAGGPLKYGRMHLREHTKGEMDAWLGKQGIHDVVAKRGFVGIRIPTEGVYEIAGAGKAGITIAKGDLDFNMRDTGKLSSKIYQLQEDTIRFLRSDAGSYMREHFAKKGMSIEDVGNLAIGFIGDSAYAAIGRDRNGKVTLYANREFFKKAEKHRKYFNLTTEEMKEQVMAEELAHNFRKSYDRLTLGRLGVIPEEVATKTDVTRIYLKMAEAATDPVDKAKYLRMAKMKYIDTLKAPITYARAALRRHSKKLGKKSEAELEALVAELAAEAAEEGITSEEGIASYVASRVDDESLEDTVEGSEESESEGDSDGGE